MKVEQQTLEVIAGIIQDHVECETEDGNFDITSEENNGLVFNCEGSFTVHKNHVTPLNRDEQPYTDIEHNITVDTVIIDIMNDETQYQLSSTEIHELNKLL